MNIVILSGRLTKDPVKRATQGGISVCNFSIAVSRPRTKKEDNLTDYFDCVIWRGGADTLEKYFHKGDGITVYGNLQNRQWTDKEGNQRNGTEIMVSEFEFPLSKKSQSAESQNAEATEAVAAGAVKATGYVETPDEELPF